VIAKSPGEYAGGQKSESAIVQSSGKSRTTAPATQTAETPSPPEVLRLAAKPVNYRGEKSAALGDPLPATTAP
jgi:hypothetical protein